MLATELDEDATVLTVRIAPEMREPGESWSKILAAFLAANTKLRLLTVENEDEERTDFYDLKNIFNALADNNTLKSLVLRDLSSKTPRIARYTTKPDYAEGLRRNKSLTKLLLDSMFIIN